MEAHLLSYTHCGEWYRKSTISHLFLHYELFLKEIFTYPSANFYVFNIQAEALK